MHESWDNVYFAQSLAPVTAALVSGNNLYPGVGGSSETPQLISKVEAVPSAEARRAKFRGNVMLSVAIDADGIPGDIKVTRGAGMGLDEKAIEAALQWRFHPARSNCVASQSPVRTSIEITFRP